jgi:amino acid adenylation domain-containing protein
MANPAAKQSYEHGGSLNLIKNTELRVGGQDTNSFASQKDVFVSDLVSTLAQDAPDTLAVVAGSDVLTYKDLISRSNQLAHYLRTMGVGPEVLVGVWLERSVDFVVAALGIMKAGGAYLPLDPAAPKARIGSILRDSQVSVCITTKRMSELMPVGTWRVVAIDADREAIALHSSSSPEITLSMANLAYVIYTSGSSGEPKGVEITHANLANLCAWHRETFGVTSADRATQVASPGFDAATWEIWPYLTSGASLSIPDRFKIATPTRFRDWLVSEHVTISFVPTALAERLIKLAWPSRVFLRFLLTGADTLRHFPPSNLPFTLINNYGPTECTVVATSGPVFSRQRSHHMPSIGRPIANTKIYILDQNQETVPAGVPGELHITGQGVARGYRNRPDLTAEKFIPNPFSADLASRLYKTGDLACYLPDGQIAFLGRIDEQMKVRGYRIEPNEIAVAIEKHPTVEASAIVSREDASGEKTLVAYIVPKPNSQVSERDLKVFLATLLPSYMVPSLFVRLDSFPITPNGKIDRATLPAPDAFNTVRDRRFIAPRTLVEERVALILCPLLQLATISVEDNFFMLGGHSLLGTQLIARVRDTFGVEITLRVLFDNPTVSGISTEVEKLILAKLEANNGGNGHGGYTTCTRHEHNRDEGH